MSRSRTYNKLKIENEKVVFLKVPMCVKQFPNKLLSNSFVGVVR